MSKTITETKLNVTAEFRSETPLYREDVRISSFIDMCKTKGIITNHVTILSEDGLTQTNVYETESPGLLDALREFYFPANQYFLEEWKSLTGNIVTESPPFSPVVLGEDEPKFLEFISEFEI